MNYLEIEYSPTSLFSLKSSEATNSASKSLLVPSPYSIKMALINGILTGGDELNFELIRDLKLHIGFKGNIVVNNSFVKYQKENRDKSIAFQPTVGYREYLFLDGTLYIALELDRDSLEYINDLVKWFARINYFGKRGSFFQFQSYKSVDDLEEFYMKKFGDSIGTVQSLDDMPKKAKFEDISNYHKNKGKRESNFYTFPFKFGKANRSFSEYQLNI
jgi:hypothetical protein